jgi:hypothetical protein
MRQTSEKCPDVDRDQSPDDLLTVAEMCAFYGGHKPIHPSTLWRGVRKGIYDPPLYISARLVRFRRSGGTRSLQRIAASREVVNANDVDSEPALQRCHSIVRQERRGAKLDEAG